MRSWLVLQLWFWWMPTLSTGPISAFHRANRMRRLSIDTPTDSRFWLHSSERVQTSMSSRTFSQFERRRMPTMWEQFFLFFSAFLKFNGITLELVLADSHFPPLLYDIYLSILYWILCGKFSVTAKCNVTYLHLILPKPSKPNSFTHQPTTLYFCTVVLSFSHTRSLLGWSKIWWSDGNDSNTTFVYSNIDRNKFRRLRLLPVESRHVHL